jgi:hypothetical protein
MNGGQDMSAAWSAIGPLVGVLIGAGLTSHIQRRQWLADRKREEYRELLTVLTESYGEVLLLHQKDDLTIDAVNKVQIRLVNTVHNRIFTSHGVMREIDVFKEWSKALDQLKSGRVGEFSSTFGALTEDIRRIALKDIENSSGIVRTGKKMLQRFSRWSR